MLDLGVGVEVCWPARGNQKGSVENLVGWVKGAFFKQRRFLDEADLRAQLAAWLEEVSTRVVSGATGVTPAARMAEEGPAAAAQGDPGRPGAAHPGVGRAHRVRPPRDPPLLDAARHHRHPGDAVPLPAARADRGGTLQRLFERSAKSTLPEHRAEAVAKVSGKRGKRYLMREHLLEAGGEALDYLNLNDRHLHSLLSEFVAYYQVDRTHLALDKDASVGRRVDPRPVPLREWWASHGSAGFIGATLGAGQRSSPTTKPNRPFPPSLPREAHPRDDHVIAHLVFPCFSSAQPDSAPSRTEASLPTPSAEAIRKWRPTAMGVHRFAAARTSCYTPKVGTRTI